MTPQEFEVAFPKVMSWNQRTVAAYDKVSHPVASKNFRRLPLYFSRMQLEAARFVVVDRIPLPPLSSIGLKRFKEFESGDFDGITWDRQADRTLLSSVIHHLSSGTAAWQDAHRARPWRAGSHVRPARLCGHPPSPGCGRRRARWQACAQSRAWCDRASGARAR